ncbi:MAG: hypothetical protein KF881_13730 [Acidobacteria bacterium]|nr:hypothetical protein [Acidobacteriota bacterium]
MSTLWILTEERPKKEVLEVILNRFATDNKISFFYSGLRILPILENGKFSFTYEVIGFDSNKVKRILLKTITGTSSFVDYIIFFQDDEPTLKDKPLYLIEETKTDDAESRNTGVYQRCSKFVFADYYYPNVQKIMLYSLRVGQKENPTATYVFGTRLLRTLGVEILGKDLDDKIYKPFKSVDEIIALKSKMRGAPKGNVPILLTKYDERIEVSARLYKSGRLAHDPNIGALSLICSALRKLGWDKDIVITQHGLSQSQLGSGNKATGAKFLTIANKLELKLQGLNVPVVSFKDQYWKYEKKGEKLGTIFIHLAVENFTEGFSIFENHAGCEKGYFKTADGQYLSLEKYSDRDAYKAGDKTKIFHIPDLIMIDCGRTEIINVEGKTYQNRFKGIEELGNYDAIEEFYIKKFYPQYKIIRTVVLYGSKERKIIELKVSFLLNEHGDLVLSIQAPKLFQEAIKNLRDYWS